MNEGEPGRDEASASEAAEGIGQLIKTLSAEMIRVVGVETRLFGHTALAMIGLTMVISLLLVGGWLFAGTALALLLAELDWFNLPGALLLVALAHLLLAALAFWRRRHIARDLMFRESRASVNSLLGHARSVGDAVGTIGSGSTGSADAAEPRTEETGGDQRRSEEG